jgi:hypothetical protein
MSPREMVAKRRSPCTKPGCGQMIFPGQKMVYVKGETPDKSRCEHLACPKSKFPVSTSPIRKPGPFENPIDNLATVWDKYFSSALKIFESATSYEARAEMAAKQADAMLVERTKRGIV